MSTSSHISEIETLNPFCEEGTVCWIVCIDFHRVIPKALLF